MTGLLRPETNNNIADTPRKELQLRHSDKHHGAGRLSKRNGLQPALLSGTLLQTLENQIIPRLVMTCRGSVLPQQLDLPAREPARKRAPHPTPGKIEIADFASLLIEQDMEQAASYLTTRCDRGVTLEWLYMELLTPTARHIGYLWEEDLCSIIDVTLAVGRLQQVIREMSPSFQGQDVFADTSRRALLIPVPGEQHTFGLSLIMEFFRRAGWTLCGWPLLGEDDLRALLRNESFGIVGISVAAEVNLVGLAALIQDIRRLSGNPNLGVMVGGPIFLKHPHLTREVGADATAVDARQAVLQAEALIRLG